jgi:uncharacterized damage-inducible protein DinB
MSSSGNARAVAEAMAASWEREHPATIRVLSAVTDDARDYRPDPRSRSAWELVTHIATSDIWFLDSIDRGVFHFDQQQASAGEASFARVSDVVEHYRSEMPGRFARVRAMSDEQLAEEVDFFGMMKMSRAEWVGFAGNHSIHHRGQLSAHLRAMGCRVPAIYGPSGDAELAEAAG